MSKRESVTTDSNRFHSLDILRFLAALGVILFHVNQSPRSWTHGLYLFVDLFFVISGFVLMPIYPKVLNSNSVLKFALKRIVRLAPLAYLTIFWVVLYELIVRIYNFIQSDIGKTNMDISFRTLIISLLFLQIFSVNASLINYPLWSLSAEMIANFILLLFPNKKRLIFFIVIYCITLLGQIYFASRTSNSGVVQLLRALNGISAGMLIRTKISIEQKMDSNKIKFASCLFLALMAFAFERTLGYLAPIISVVFFALLIRELVQFELSSNRKIPEKISSLMGSMSYGLYVWHVPVASLISVVLIKANRGQSLNYLSQYLMLFGCTLIVSFFSIMYFEKPIQRLAQKKMVRFFIK